MKLYNGKLSKWFMNARDEEIMMLEIMSPGALSRLCLMLTLEQQILLENDRL